MNAASGSAAAHHEHPSRPFRAGFIAGHGSTLWLLDVSRPILVRRARDGACSTHAVPGHLRTSGIVGWTPVRLHPDAAGCWVAGVDGTAHCSHDGTVRALDPEPVRASALYAGVLATVARADASTLALRGVSGETVTVALPQRRIVSVPPMRGSSCLCGRTRRVVLPRGVIAGCGAPE
ncbi:hypothetical protein GTA07_21785 [Rhodococcus hoagii]|nr:hypothetical protein [Prescottella equi]